MSQRVEANFHDQIWRAANDWTEIHGAIAQARDLIYLVAALDGDQYEGHRAAANHWLDRYGRNPLTERRLKGVQ